MKSVKVNLLIALGLVLLLVTSAQSQFVKTLGGDFLEEGFSIIEGFDGEIYVTGHTSSFGVGYSYDLLLVKFAASGDLMWTRTLGGSNSDKGSCLIQTADSGIVVTGYSVSLGYPLYTGLILAKFNTSGDTIWTKVLGEEGAENAYLGESLVEASDGAIIVTGHVSYFGQFAFLLARYDASGNLIWARTLDMPGDDIGASALETYDGGIVVTGFASVGLGGRDLLLAKFSASGTPLWATAVGGTGRDEGTSVVEAADGGLVVTGFTDSFGAGGAVLFLAKFDASGNPLWTRTLAETGPYGGQSVIEASDGGLVVTGTFDGDLLLSKFDSSGTHLWTKVLGGSSFENGNSVIQRSDGELIVTGMTLSFGAGTYDLLLAKFDSSGNTCMGEFVTPDIQSISPDVLHPSLTPISPPAIDTAVTFTVSEPDPTVQFVCGHEPKIISITDVGNDQGRQVRVIWERCYYDTVGSLVTINQYSIWRRADSDKSGIWDTESQEIKVVESIEEMFAQVALAEPGDRFLVSGVEGSSGTVWVFITTVPAMQFQEYAYDAPTECDSTVDRGMCWSVFFVAAHTEDPLVHYDSDPDSGYSLDNIPPLPILDLEIDPNSWFTLQWTVPGEYVGEQPISSYDVRYDTVAVGDPETWWENAAPCSGDGFFSLVVGDQDSFQVMMECLCHPEVYIAVKGLDDRPNASGISNIVHFLCGDVNEDGVVNVGDVVYEVSYLYKGGPAPVPGASGDVNCDGIVDVGDVVYLVSYLYRGGPAPCSQ